MEDSECEHLLRSNLDLGVQGVGSAELQALASRLEHLPLALVQATSFIRTRSLSVDRYMRLLGENDESVINLLSEEFETVGRDSETPRALAQTWILSFRQIERQNSLAGHFLSLVSFFDRQRIPTAFFSHYSQEECNGGPISELEVVNALGLLKAFSLATEESDDFLNIHRLVHLITRKWLRMEGTIGQFEKAALSTLSSLYPRLGIDSRTTRTEYLPHAMAVLKVEVDLKAHGAKEKASLLHSVANHLNSEGQWKDAEKLLEKATWMKKEVFGTDDPSSLTSMLDLARHTPLQSLALVKR
ncbi:hypothetical protein ACHAQH_001108 [Verticillium albo-atrum]